MSDNVIDITVRVNDETAKGMDSAGKSGNVLKGVFQGIGQVAGNMLADLPGQAIGFFKGAIDAASDLGETVSKNQTIFGAAAGELMTWAESAPKALGMTKQAALEATGTLGNLFTQLGVTSDEARKLSQSNVQLATDFASFHNADPTEVLEAMTAAYRGEYDAVQRFVPVLNAAKVEEEALAMTHKKSAKELTEKDKALAVSAIMTKNAGAANGDFARTSDSAANRARIAAASFEEMKVKIGNVLLPAWTALLGFITNSFFPALTQLGSLIGGVVSPVFEELKGGVSALLSAWENFNDGVTSSGFAGWMEELGINARRIFNGIKDAWSLLTTGMVTDELETNLGSLGPTIKEFADNVRALAAEWLPKLQSAFTEASGRLSEFWSIIKGNENLLITVGIIVGGLLVAAFLALAAAAWSAAAGVIAATWPFVAIVAVIFALVAGLRYAYDNWEFFRVGVNAVVQWLITNVPPAFEVVRAAIAAAVEWIVGVAVPWFQMAFGSFVAFLQGTFMPAVTTVWNDFIVKVQAVVAMVSEYIARMSAFITDNWNWISGLTAAIWAQITNIISSAWQVISNLVQLFLNIISGNWAGAWQNIKNILEAVISGMVQTVQNFASIIGNLFMLVVSYAGNMLGGVVNKLGEMEGWFRGLPGRILGAVGDLGSLLVGAGRSILDGLVRGFLDSLGSAKSRISDGISSIRNLFPFSPAKEGPFSGRGWVTYSGEAIASGLAEGMMSKIGNVTSAAYAVTGAAHPYGAGASSGGSGPAGGSGQISFGGDTDGAFATAFMQLVRSGKIQLTGTF